MSKIVSVLPINESQRKKLSQTAQEVGATIEFSSVNGVTLQQIQSADCVIGNAPPQFFKEAHNVKLLQTNSAGTDQYVAPGILSDKTLLANATGAYSPAVGEHMLAVTLMLQKKLHYYRDAQLQKEWSDFGQISSLNGATVLIIGAGDIGLHYAKLVKLLGAYTIGVKRRLSEKPEYIDELYLQDKVDSLLPRADIVAAILPGTKQTAMFFNKQRFALMKSTSFFINAGRGASVNQEDLLYALQNNIIAGASIDVTTPEPLPKDHPLWQCSNLILTPHVAGGFHLPLTMDRIVDIACENIINLFNHKTLKNEVDFLTGYKK